MTLIVNCHLLEELVIMVVHINKTKEKSNLLVLFLVTITFVTFVHGWSKVEVEHERSNNGRKIAKRGIFIAFGNIFSMAHFFHVCLRISLQMFN